MKLTEAFREYLIAFVFPRKNKCRNTWYVDYFVNGWLVHKPVGGSKASPIKLWEILREGWMIGEQVC
jgi:hypothetical protein